MEIIFVLIPIALIFVVIAIRVFFWAVKSEQFEDLDRQGYSILFDEHTERPGQNSQEQPQQPSVGQQSTSDDHVGK